jgi:SAD/SRA domain
MRKLGLFMATQASVDGNAHVGATAVLITESNNYPNKFYYDNNKEVVRITYIGRGGRTMVQDPETGKNKYTFTFNQPGSRNQAIFFSAENNLPIRVITSTTEPFNNTVIITFKYIGLYTVTEYSYKPLDPFGVKIFQFNLEKYVNK